MASNRSFQNYCVATLLTTLALLSISAQAAPPTLDSVTSITSSPQAVTLSMGHDRLVVRICRPEIIRIDYQKAGQTDPETPVLDPEQKWDSQTKPNIEDGGNAIIIQTDKARLQIDKSPCRISLYAPAGHCLLSNGTAFIDHTSNLRGGVRFAHPDFAHFYGVKAFDIADSEKNSAARTLLRDGTFQANASTQGGCGTPFIWTTAGFALLVDSDNGFFSTTDHDLAFDYGAPSASTNGRLYEKKNSITFFLIVGNPHQIFAGLSDITGHAPMFPKWAVGFTNSQWGITQDMAITAIDHYRAAAIPIDNFTFDFDWKAWGEDNFGEFRWNKSNFPSANATSEQTFAQKMADRHIKITGIMKPRIVRFTDPAGMGPETIQGKEADDHHFWLPGLDRHTDYMSQLPCGELDFSIPACRAWFWNNVKRWGAMQGGISGFWNDEADEADLGNKHHVVFNNFEHMRMQQALYDGQRAWIENAHHITRVWSLNRNFYLGAQRYAYGTWSGDIASGFESMALQPARMLSAISLGQMRWSMDTGGFHGTPTPENYARWMEFAAFVPIFRVHGTHLEHRQPWVYGEKAEMAATEAIRLRYRLVPYIYACDRELYEKGIGLVRPLMIEFPDDQKSADVTDEWMFGASLLAAPVLQEHASQRTVYLPPGNWIDYFRGNRFRGGQTIIYPINQNSWMDIPLFIREGSIVVTQDVMPSIGAGKPKQIYLDVFANHQKSTATVYDDDGESYDCEKSGYLKQSITAVRSGDGLSATMTIAPREGSYQPSFRSYIARIHGIAARSATLNGQPLTEANHLPDLADKLGAWTRGRDVYGEFTSICFSAATTKQLHLVLTGHAKVSDLTDSLAENGTLYETEPLEAEDGILSGETSDTTPVVAHDHPGYTGTGFVGGLNHPFAAITFSVKRQFGGTYRALLRFADFHHQESLGLLINGEKIANVAFPTTADWDDWKELPVDLPLVSGNNVISLRRGPENTGDIILDSIKIAWEPK